MRKEHLTYILIAALVIISSIFVAPTAVYARMGMPDLNVAGVSDDGSTYREERAKQERENKKARANVEESVPSSVRNNVAQSPSQTQTESRQNDVSNFQNDPPQYTVSVEREEKGSVNEQAPLTAPVKEMEETKDEDMSDKDLEDVWRKMAPIFYGAIFGILAYVGFAIYARVSVTNCARHKHQA